MTYHIDIQKATEATLPITDQDLILWAEETLKNHLPEAELTIRIVDKEEITFLNTNYRKQSKPTNVLAFPAELPEGIELELPLLGDVIVCAEVLLEESKVNNRPLKAHWAHIIIHGILHLLGYDHIEEADCAKMQAKEVTILANLGYANPYNTEDFEFD